LRSPPPLPFPPLRSLIPPPHPPLLHLPFRRPRDLPASRRSQSDQHPFASLLRASPRASPQHDRDRAVWPRCVRIRSRQFHSAQQLGLPRSARRPERALFRARPEAPPLLSRGLPCPCMFCLQRVPQVL